MPHRGVTELKRREGILTLHDTFLPKGETDVHQVHFHRETPHLSMSFAIPFLCDRHERMRVEDTPPPLNMPVDVFRAAGKG